MRGDTPRDQLVVALLWLYQNLIPERIRHRRYCTCPPGQTKTREEGARNVREYTQPTYGDAVHTHLWFVTGERHEPDLVCQVLRTQVDGNNDVVNTHWQDIQGLIMLITEEQRRVDPSGLAVGVVDTRTRLVVRRYEDPEGNGSAVGFEPLVVDLTGEGGIDGVGDYRTLRFVRREDAEANRSDVQEVRRTGRATDIAREAKRLMLEMFTDERLERTELDSIVRLPVAHASYLDWCSERHVRPASRFEFHEFTHELARAGYRTSDKPRALDGGRYEYVIEHVRLLDR